MGPSAFPSSEYCVKNKNDYIYPERDLLAGRYSEQKEMPMNQCKMPVTIILADDDPDDQLLVKDAFGQNCSCVRLHFVNSGQELLDYLNEVVILPGLILLDINMPTIGGIEALERIKNNPRLINIPIIIFTTSTDKDLILTSYCVGANSFINKPDSFDRLVDIIDVVSKYWCNIVVLPDTLCPVETKPA
jgi:two-component system response regulator